MSEVLRAAKPGGEPLPEGLLWLHLTGKGCLYVPLKGISCTKHIDRNKIIRFSLQVAMGNFLIVIDAADGAKLATSLACSNGSKSGDSMKCSGFQGFGMKVSMKHLGPSMI
ncbi:hypothetical protein CTI12_AA277180 [Artemisia annua]|uniref:Uncharacterized protein n=1 Tax=Artemisia annua TaxID=35608 RepID=A0A2U1NDP1_ARTAN|nr:hypothetical protein CTI12_AA277180 [Artemisia annua]